MALELPGTAIYIAAYAVNLPWMEHAHLSCIHVGSLVSLELAGVWFLSLVGRQRREREWSPLLTVFTLLMNSFTGFVLSEPAVTVGGKRIVPAERRGGEPQKQPAAVRAVALRKK